MLLKCKMCGGDLDIQPGKKIAECMYCGSMQTVPNIDDERRANLFARAGQFRLNGEFDKAMAVYDEILREDTTDAEAHWSMVLCKYGIDYVQDPKTRRRVPTVNRMQYISVFEDADYIETIKHADASQKEVYEIEANAIENIRNAILEISKKEKPFDIFISYKETDSLGRRTEDSVYAYDIYEKLTAEGYRVFFSRVTLESVVGTAYEPYIFAALNSAKVMLVVGTSAENMNSVWVRNEWSRYLLLMKQDKSKSLIPIYKDMNPYDLPAEFSYLQAQDYGKLGALQDIVRGIQKIIKISLNDKTIGQNQKQSFEDIRIEKEINKAIDFMNSKSIRKIKEAKKIFDKLSYSYDTSREIAECKKLISEIGKQKKKKAIVWLIVLLFVSASCFSYIYVKVLLPQNKYEKAANYVLEEKFDLAINIYRELGEYKDSFQKINETMYSKALALKNEGDIIQAAKILGELGDYKDANEEKVRLITEIVNEKYESGKYEEGKEILADFYNVEESEQMALVYESYYEGLSAYKEQNYSKAIKCFENSSVFLDSKEYIYQSAIALSKLTSRESNTGGNNYMLVCGAFESISGYKDADALLTNYKNGLKKSINDRYN